MMAPQPLYVAIVYPKPDNVDVYKNAAYAADDVKPLLDVVEKLRRQYPNNATVSALVLGFDSYVIQRYTAESKMSHWMHLNAKGMWKDLLAMPPG